jgi:hypothetical protein
VNREHLPRGHIHIEDRWPPLALPSRDVGEIGAALTPKPAILVNVAKHMQQGPNPANRREQILTATTTVFAQPIPDAKRWAVGDQHIGASGNQRLLARQCRPPRQVESPGVVLRLPGATPEPDPLDYRPGVLKVGHARPE